MSWVGLAPPPGLITDPLLAAAPRELDPAGRLTPHPRGLGLVAERHATNGAIYANTLVLAVGLEALAVAVDNTIMLTASANHIWRAGRKALTNHRHRVAGQTILK